MGVVFGRSETMHRYLNQIWDTRQMILVLQRRNRGFIPEQYQPHWVSSVCGCRHKTFEHAFGLKFRSSKSLWRSPYEFPSTATNLLRSPQMHWLLPVFETKLAKRLWSSAMSCTRHVRAFYKSGYHLNDLHDAREQKLLVERLRQFDDAFSRLVLFVELADNGKVPSIIPYRDAIFKLVQETHSWIWSRPASELRSTLLSLPEGRARLQDLIRVQD